jgi:hypothetical protein
MRWAEVRRVRSRRVLVRRKGYDFDFVAFRIPQERRVIVLIVLADAGGAVIHPAGCATGLVAAVDNCAMARAERNVDPISGSGPLSIYRPFEAEKDFGET